MNSNEKRWIVLLIAVVIIAVVLIVALNIINGQENNPPANNGQTQEETQTNEEKYTTELVDGTKINTSEEFNTNKTYGNLTISNIQFTEKDGVTTLLADVTNNGSARHELEIVKLKLIGENDEVIEETNTVIEDIEPGETVQLNASFNTDVINVKDFRIEAAQ